MDKKLLVKPGAKKIKEMKDPSSKYLSDRFWLAFFNNEFYNDKTQLHAQFKKFSLNIPNSLYLDTIFLPKLDSKDYIINILAIKGMFFISFNVDILPFRYSSIVGIIKFHKNQNSFEYNKIRLGENPLMKKIFDEIRIELQTRNIKLEKEVPIKPLSYIKFIHILLVSALWKHYIDISPSSEIEYRVRKIMNELNLSFIKTIDHGRMSSIDLVRKEALILNRKYMTNWKTKSLLKKYEDLQTVRDEINGFNFLNNIFWDAFTTGKYGTTNDDIWFIEFSLEDMLTGFVYSASFIRNNYIISILVTKGIFLINLHSSQMDPHHLGLFYYNKYKDKFIAEYYQVLTARENPIALLIFNKISQELKQKVELKIKERYSGHLPFLRPLKTILICALWRKFNKLNELSVIAIAEKISLILDIEISTVCVYAQATPDPRVRREAGKARNLSIIKLYELDKRWMTLIKNNPEFTPQERAKKIASELGKSAFSIAGALRFSKIDKVKQEAIKAYSRLTDSLYQITPLWVETILKHPELNPLQHANKIASINQITLNNVANIGRFSENRDVSKEAKIVFDHLMERRYLIKERWIEYKKSDPKSDALEIIKKIKEDTNLSILTIYNLCKMVKDETIQKEARIALKKYDEEKYGIGKKWVEVLKNFPHLNEVDQANRVATFISLSAYETAAKGRYSENKQVRAKANKAFKTLSELRYRIREKWEELVSLDPTFSYIDIIEILSSQLNKTPLTIIGYAKYSESKTIRKAAGSASNYFRIKNYQINRKFQEIENQNPELSSEEIFKIIAKNENKEFRTIISLAKHSDNSHIKNEAFRLKQIYFAKEKGIEKKWLKLIEQNCDLYPWERATVLANSLNIGISTLCTIAIYCSDPNVTFEASLTRSYLDKKGIFNPQFENVLRIIVRIINESIRKNQKTINTAYVGKEISNFPLGRNASRNLIALCLRCLANLDMLVSKKNQGVYEYEIPARTLDINEILKQVINKTNLVKIMKGLRKIP